MTARLVAHWLSFGPLILIATLPASALLSLTGQTFWRLLASLLAGTPGLAAIGLITSALLASLRGGTALAGLMLAPVAVPLVIFGAGHLARDDISGALFAAAFSLVLCAIAPFAAAAAMARSAGCATRCGPAQKSAGSIRWIYSRGEGLDRLLGNRGWGVWGRCCAAVFEKG